LLSLLANPHDFSPDFWGKCIKTIAFIGLGFLENARGQKIHGLENHLSQVLFKLSRQLFLTQKIPCSNPPERSLLFDNFVCAGGV
jgi:hypothetical protein